MELTGKRLNVLLIEDDQSDVYLIIKYLKQHWTDVNYSMVYSIDAVVNALKLKWDVILCDFNLPGFDGMTAFRLVREQGISVPFILVSGEVTEDVAALMMRLGANDYVFKNNLNRLAPAILRELKSVETLKETGLPVKAEKKENQKKRGVANKLLAPIVVESKVITERDKAVINMLFVAEFIRKHQSAVLEKQNLTVPRLNVLRILKQVCPEGITITDIKEAMIYKTVDLSRMIDKMNKEGLVNVVKNKATREIAITVRGLDALDAADNAEEMFMPQNFLSEENAKQINEALQNTLNSIK